MTAKTFDPTFYPRDVALVGLGGTGAQWARSLARMVYAMQQAGRSIPTVTFVDPDRVEAQNVGRQLFTVGDVGQYKAEVLARRFNYALGLSIRWCNEPVHADRHLADNRTLICGAVDNYLARRELAQARGIWIDASNHRDSGQVAIGNTTDPRHVLNALAGDNNRIYYLPSPGLLFPALLEPEPMPAASPAQSCADLTAAGEQHLLVNDFLAAVAASYTYQVLHRQPVMSFVTYIDVISLTVRSLPITREQLLPYLVAETEELAA